ncbi:MAG: tRNA (N6-isopentenyl adenosine(37)-C2)-methylthiotransferase MiaB [Phycisphaerae bacterium]|jgi:tRNA-2-methylthio-N6-dimethylallyladenosine synthase|nr:tRNA (N6-isopentenyl adenosine(37)-C2)-methylthiotransferase MiaB [Phycisphaerae bacterium]
MKIYLETMGCQMNRLDSELVTGRLLAAGHEITDDRKSADVVLYNTCSVRAHAENKVYSRLGEEARRKGNLKHPPIVGVLGCMVQRQGPALRKRYPCVDIACGPRQLSDLPEMILNAAAGKTTVARDPDRKTARDAFENDPNFDVLDQGRDPCIGPNARAYVRVMRGCDKFCTYCIVPFVRGPEISRKPSAIVEEVRRLVAAGRCEITLLGQTVNSYCHRAGEQTVSFSDLLGRVSDIEGLRRLRFVTSHPIDFGNDILEAMRDLPNICPYVHCPAQSGSDRILKAMGRNYTREQYDDLIDRARAIVPDVVLAGDFIVGFPGESEQDHAASADLIRRSGYKNSFIFKYSPRPGTAGARHLVDDIPAAVKKYRNNELLAVQAEAGLAHHRKLIGRTMEVLVEGPSRRAGKQPKAPANPGHLQLVGRTRGDHIAVFDGPRDLAGQYANIHITGASALTLFGQLR